VDEEMKWTGVQARGILGENGPCPKTRELTVVTAIKTFKPTGRRNTLRMHLSGMQIVCLISS
jgi:DMSO/TMAO reductase YedYZ molybdopterin-dependent catalytic subunit